MKVNCNQCQRIVKLRASGKVPWHRDNPLQRKWCRTSPGWSPKTGVHVVKPESIVR